MPLDPRAAALIEKMSAARAAAMPSIADMRKLSAASTTLSGTPEAVASIEDFVLDFDDRTLRLRLYRPASGEDTPPCMLYIHGGGFCLGSIEAAEGPITALCNRSGCAIASLEYRLAPETPFPGAVEDACATFAWLTENATRLGLEPKNIGICGDSAGGSIAAGATLMAHDRGGPTPKFQFLIYPATDLLCESESYATFAEGYIATRALTMRYVEHYVPDPAQRAHPYGSPLRRDDLTGAAPAVIFTAEYDPMRDEGEAYAQRLREAGVPAVHHRVSGQIHGFFHWGGALDPDRAILNEMGRALRALAAR